MGKTHDDVKVSQMAEAEVEKQKRVTNMDETHADALVISDAKGNYYVVPREHLQLSKVDQTAKAEVEKMLDSRKGKPIILGEGFSFVGFMSLPEDARWTHYSADIAWPH